MDQTRHINSEFLKFHAQPIQLGEENLNELKRLAAQFPYCQSVKLLVAKASEHTESYERNLSSAAALVSSRDILYNFIQKTEEFSSEIPLNEEQNIPENSAFGINLDDFSSSEWHEPSTEENDSINQAIHKTEFIESLDVDDFATQEKVAVNQYDLNNGAEEGHHPESGEVELQSNESYGDQVSDLEAEELIHEESIDSETESLEEQPETLSTEEGAEKKENSDVVVEPTTIVEQLNDETYLETEHPEDLIKPVVDVSPITVKEDGSQQSLENPTLKNLKVTNEELADEEVDVVENLENADVESEQISASQDQEISLVTHAKDNQDDEGEVEKEHQDNSPTKAEDILFSQNIELKDERITSEDITQPQKLSDSPDNFSEDTTVVNDTSEALQEQPLPILEDSSINELSNRGLVPAAKTPSEELTSSSLEEKDELSQYDDETMPYTFLWWLQKTRKEHALNNQPYVFKADSSNQTFKPLSKPVDDLNLQITENIFHLKSFDNFNDQAEVQAETTPSEDRKDLKIIEKFIKEEPQIKPPSANKIDTENKAKRSSEDANDVVSETLAKIYIEQMLYHKALDVYKKLSLKFPEKSAYFASQIKYLELKVN